ECTLFRLYDDQAILRPVLYVGQHTEQIMALELRVGQGVTGTCVAKNQPILANFALRDPRAMQVNGTPEEANEHIMAAPLVFHEQVIGAMLVSRYTGQPFTENELSLFVGFAQQATIAFKNAQLFQKLELYTSDLERLVAERTAELLQSKERVETILRNSPEAILLLGINGAVETVNPAFSKMFGYSSPEITEQSPVELIAPDYAEAFSDALHTVLTGGQTGRVRVLVQRKDGMRFDADAALAPVVEDGAVTGLVCGIHDISAFKEVERLKDEFVSNVTHELRTPITSIRLYHDLLVRNPVKSDVYMDRLARETSRLERIIDDLLYLSRLDQGRVVFKPQLMDLNRLARQYVTDRTPLADSRSLTLILVEASDVLPIQADEGLIGQALSILLTNALNYTPPGGSVTVYTLTREVEGQQWAGIRVSDTGPGIPPDEQPRLFKRFFRGQAGRESNTPGTGLGLALLHDIVQRHHGQVEVFSDGIPGQGTTFTIWLPVSPPPSLPEAPPPA
ncbi:MAG: PAS domain S-box protein, partial [Anaerolineae bacterium]|nr:PAS domain S-box protein [Anaerolineae bacterium]